MVESYREEMIGLALLIMWATQLTTQQEAAGIMTSEQMAMKKAQSLTLKLKTIETHLSHGWDY